MTLADVLKPSLIVLAHGKMMGVTIGAGAGALIAIPTLAIKPSTINPNNSPALVAIAGVSGIGAIIGGSILGTACAVKIYKLDAEGIKDRADRLVNNVDQSHMALAALDGAVIGIGAACNRFYKLSKANDTTFTQEAFTKPSAWEAFGFTVLGASVGVGVLLLGKYSIKSVGCIMEKIKESKNKIVEDVDTVIQDTADNVEQVAKDVEENAVKAVNDASQAASSAATDVEKKLKENIDSVKEETS